MRQFELKRALFGADITAQIAVFDEGVQVSVFGGTRTHIGAVSVAGIADESAYIQFPGHRDGVISRAWAEALLEEGFCPAVVTAGIHYDNLSREQITEVVEITDDMLDELLHTLKDTR